MKLYLLVLLFGLSSAASLVQNEKRYVEDDVDIALAELNVFDMLRQVREHIKKNVDPELLKEKIKKIFHQGGEMLDNLLRTLKEKGRDRLEMLIDAILSDEQEGVSKRGIKDYWEKIKDYFKDLKIDLQEKYIKFGEWVKENFKEKMEVSKDKLDNIRAIAKEFLKHAKGISKEVASEAGEFFRNYKDDLGVVWEELKERISEIRNRKD